MLGIVFKNGQEIDRGIWVAGKQWTPAYPDQSITICDYADAYSIENERTYQHGDGISFQEVQEGGHIAYDSNEMVDRAKRYPLPKWLTGGGPIPNYGHSVDAGGQEVTRYKGVVK